MNIISGVLLVAVICLSVIVVFLVCCLLETKKINSDIRKILYYTDILFGRFWEIGNQAERRGIAFIVHINLSCIYENYGDIDVYKKFVSSARKSLESMIYEKKNNCEERSEKTR